MTTQGPPPPFVELTDDKGNVYSFSKHLGRGAMGFAVGASVKSSVNGLQNPGDRVVIKVLTDNEELEEFIQESENLAKVGDRVGVHTPKPGDPNQHLCIVIKLAPGEDLRDVIYQIDKKQNNPYVGFNPNLSDKDKLNISSGLLQEISTLHVLGILHRDIKLDNVKYDSITGMLKLIDMGQASDLDKGKAGQHAPPGWHVAVPEAHMKGQPETIQNEGYIVGMILASLYSNTPFEREALKRRNELKNSPLEARKLLDDVLKATEPPNGMSPGLWKVVRELTHEDSTQRPEGILFCKALDELGDKQLIQMRDNIQANNKKLASLSPSVIEKGMTGNTKEQYEQMQRFERAVIFLQMALDSGKTDSFNSLLKKYSEAQDIPEKARTLFKNIANEKGNQAEIMAAINKAKPEIFAGSPLQFVKDYEQIFKNHEHPTIIRNEVNALATKYAQYPDLVNFVNQRVLEMDGFRTKQARDMQQERNKLAAQAKGDKVKDTHQSLIDISSTLKELALTHRTSDQAAPIIHSAMGHLPPGLNNDGKRLYMAGETIRKCINNPDMSPKQVQEALGKLSDSLSKEKETNPKAVEKIEKAIAKYHQGIESERTVTQERSRSPGPTTSR